MENYYAITIHIPENLTVYVDSFSPINGKRQKVNDSLFSGSLVHISEPKLDDFGRFLLVFSANRNKILLPDDVNIYFYRDGVILGVINFDDQGNLDKSYLGVLEIVD